MLKKECYKEEGEKKKTDWEEMEIKLIPTGLSCLKCAGFGYAKKGTSEKRREGKKKICKLNGNLASDQNE